MIHEKNWRVKSLCWNTFHPQDSLWTLVTIPVCRNDTGRPVRDRGFFFGFGFLVGLVNNGSPRSIRSTCELDTSTGWESIPHRSSRARVALSFDTVENVMVGEVDELEEDVGWSRSCLEGVIYVEEWELDDVGSPKSTSLLSTFHIGSILCFFPASFMSSTYTDKNNPFSRWAKRHSQFGIFSHPCFNRTFSNCLSHNSPAKGWPYRFRSRATTESSMLDHDLGHLCFGLWNFQYRWGIFHFDLGVSWYFVRCLSCAPWQSGYDIHDFCRRHLWCWRSLFCKYCIRSRIIFHNVPRCTTLPLYFWYWGSNSEFLRWQLPSFLASSITSDLFLTFVSCHASIYSKLSLSFSTAAVQRIHPFLSDMILVMFVSSFLPALVSCIRRHRQHKHIWSCVSQNCGGFQLLFSVFCKALLPASEFPTFY